MLIGAPFLRLSLRVRPSLLRQNWAMPDLSFIASVATVAAALFAAFPLVLGATRGHRLRRDEQTLREAASVTPDERQRAILLSLHQQAAGRLVASQLTPPWRVWWPLLAFVSFAVAYVDTGRRLGDWFSAHPNDWHGYFATQLMGDWFQVMALVGFGPTFLAQLYSGLAARLKFRAKSAEKYVLGSGTIQAKPMLGLDTWAPEGGWTWRAFFGSLTVGYSTASLATASGVLWALPRGTDQSSPLAGLLSSAIITAALGMTGLLFSAPLLWDPEPGSGLPMEHPSGVHSLPEVLEPVAPQAETQRRLAPRVWRWLQR